MPNATDFQSGVHWPIFPQTYHIEPLNHFFRKGGVVMVTWRRKNTLGGDMHSHDRLVVAAVVVVVVVVVVDLETYNLHINFRWLLLTWIDVRANVGQWVTHISWLSTDGQFPCLLHIIYLLLLVDRSEVIIVTRAYSCCLVGRLCYLQFCLHCLLSPEVLSVPRLCHPATILTFLSYNKMAKNCCL